MNIDGLTPRPVVGRLRVLLADGSSIASRAICEALRESPDIEILGVVQDGNEAIAKVRELRPGVLLLAMDIPKGDGARVLREVMSATPVPVIMIGAEHSSGGMTASRLIEMGAVETLPRPQTLTDERVAREWRTNLASVVKRAGRVKVVRVIASKDSSDFPMGSLRTPTPRGAGELDGLSELRSPSPMGMGVRRRIVLVGSSTGGPDALRVLVKSFPADFPFPVVIAQHMPEGFTVSLAALLQAECRLTVQEAVDGERIRGGTVYVGPGGMHLRVKNGGLLQVVAARRDEHCPSVDTLFQTGAAVYGSGVLAVVLTGIGSDGAAGVRTVHACGGRVVAQDEATSKIYGMPQAAAETGCVDVVAGIADIGPLIARHALGVAP